MCVFLVGRESMREERMDGKGKEEDGKGGERSRRKEKGGEEKE